MAMNIISKEKKEIRWIGLPTNSVQECEHIQVSKLHVYVHMTLMMLHYNVIYMLSAVYMLVIH